MLLLSLRGYPGYLWVGVCRWDSGTLTLYQTMDMFSWILRPYSRLDAKIPTLFQTCSIVSMVQSFSSQSVAYMANDSLFQTKIVWFVYPIYPRINCSKTLPFTASHTYKPCMWEFPPPRGPQGWRCARMLSYAGKNYSIPLSLMLLSLFLF